MLKISSLTYTVTSGKSPYTYAWSSENPCISFEPATGVAANSFVTNIFADNISCFSSGATEVVLTLVDGNGCKTEHSFFPTSPCNEFQLSSILSTNNKLAFKVIASGPSGPYSYEWTSQDSIYTQIAIPQGSDGSDVVLQVKTNKAIPKNWSTILSVTVTDKIGCIKTITREVGICNPIVLPVVTRGNCLPIDNDPPSFTLIERKYETAEFTIPVTPCKDCNIAWDKTKFKLANPNWIVKFITNPARFKIEGIVDSDFTNGIILIPFNLYDCNGSESTNSFVRIDQGFCAEASEICPLIVKDLCIQSCEDIVRINLEDLIISPKCCNDNAIDWGSLYVNPNSPFDPSYTTIDGLNHYLVYNRNTAAWEALDLVPPNSDVIYWSIEDTKGNHSGTKFIQIANYCPAPPTLIPDCYFLNADDFQYELDVLANDPGPNLVPSTLMLLTYPTHGTAFVFNGKIYYTPYTGYLGSDTFDYKVANTDGIFASTTVTLEIQNTSEGEITTCLSDPDTFGNIIVDQLVDDSGGFNVILYGGINNNGNIEPLAANDEIDFDVLVNNVVTASATLLVGTNMKTTVKGGTDNNWLTGTNFAQWVSSNLLNPVTLVTGDNFRFDKKGWAFDNNKTNFHLDPFKPGAEVLNATEVTFRIKVRDVSTVNDSGFHADIVPLVKKFAFEDTTHVDTLTNANFAGGWEWVPGYVGVWDNCTSSCNCQYHNLSTLDHLMTVYSEINSAETNCTKTIIEYKKTGQVAQSTSLVLNAAASEDDMKLMINTLDARWLMDYRSWDTYTSLPMVPEDYNLWGHQAGYLNSNYLTVTESGLEYFIMEYTPQAGENFSNQGKRIKCTISSKILF